MSGVTRRRLALAILGLGLATAAVAAVVFLVPLAAWIAAFQAYFARIGPAGPLVFFAIYVIGTATVVPAAPFSLLAGVMFGLIGFPFAILAATTGASLAFLASRYLLRAWVADLMAGDAKFAAFGRAIEAEGWRMVGLTRMSPVVPFNVQSLVFGVTGIRFVPYAVATSIGIMPNTAFLVYLGSIGRATASDAGPVRWTMTGIGLLATLLAVVLVSRAARRRIAAIGAS